MTVDRRHAIHLCGDAERRIDELFAVPAAEDLARLGLDLLLFAASDERDDIIEDGVRRNARVAGS